MLSLVDRNLPISNTTLSYQRAMDYFGPVDSETGQKVKSFSSLQYHGGRGLQGGVMIRRQAQ